MIQNPKQFSTQGIILTRTDYGEADRILTFITPDRGKITAIAKGVRKAQAKLAGAIELFSVVDITVVVGRAEIDTLISARLKVHFGNIVKDIKRTNTGYEMLNFLNKATDTKAEAGYFELLQKTLIALNNLDILVELTKLWFKMQLLKLSGHAPNLRTDENGKQLAQAKNYNFDYDKMRFKTDEQGDFSINHLKFLRLGFGINTPPALSRIQNVEQLVKDCELLLDTILKTYIRL